MLPRSSVGWHEKTILPYHLGLAALSGQLPPNIARYILLERAMAETMVGGGVTGARRKDAFELLLTKMADVLKEAKILTEQECKTIIRYAAQYEARAVRFLFERPARYTQRIVVRLCEQYAHTRGSCSNSSVFCSLSIIRRQEDSACIPTLRKRISTACLAFRRPVMP
jgi:hypothetical protein